jgi:hypothetical protein
MPRAASRFGRLAAAALILAASRGPAARAAEPASVEIPRSSAIAGLGHGSQGFVVTPNRIVFDGRRRYSTLTLANTGEGPAAYRLSLVRMRMSITGEITPVDTPEAGEAFADTLVRFSPHQFEVAPRSFQVVRLLVRVPPGLPDGEYRSHLLIQEIPVPGPNQEMVASNQSGIQIRLTPVFGTAIPVIVRKGQPSAQVSFADVHYRAGASLHEKSSLTLKLVRAGERSIFGDLECLAVRPGHQSRVVGVLKGIAVYTPNRERQIDVALESNPVDKGEALRVRFSETALYAGYAGATAESTLLVR